jgi:hypothetical protein
LQTAAVGGLAVIAAWVKWSTQGALGILAGVPIGILGLNFLFRAFRVLPGEDLSRARQRGMKLYLCRMILDFSAILASIPFGADFMVGVFAGLFCQAIPFLVSFLLSPFVRKVVVEE